MYRDDSEDSCVYIFRYVNPRWAESGFLFYQYIDDTWIPVKDVLPWMEAILTLNKQSAQDKPLIYGGRDADTLYFSF